MCLALFSNFYALAFQLSSLLREAEKVSGINGGLYVQLLPTMLRMQHLLLQLPERMGYAASTFPSQPFLSTCTKPSKF